MVNAMTQPNLFDCDGPPRLQDFKRPARATDPPTSHEAADDIEPKLGKLAERMLHQFLQPRTANEAAELCVSKYPDNTNLESYRKRRGDLGKLIEKVCTKTCEVTGHKADAFVITQKGRRLIES